MGKRKENKLNKTKSQDQRSLTDQLQDVWKFARNEKMYDAADFIIEKMKNYKVEMRGKEILVQPIVSQSGRDGGHGGTLFAGGESFWNERKEYINNDPMFHSYYSLYRNGVDLNELKDNMITHLLEIKKELIEQLIDAESRAIPRSWVGENFSAEYDKDCV